MERFETTILVDMDKDSNKTNSMLQCKRPSITVQLALTESEKLTSSFLLSVIVFIGSFANPMMIACLCRIWSTNRSMCRHLLHLAIGDMIRVFFCLPIRLLGYFQIVTFESKYRPLFQIRTFLDIFTEILQLQVLLLISSDRYFAVAKPFKKYNENKSNSVFVLACSWGVAILGASCTLYFYEDYVKIIEICEIKLSLYAFMILILIFESGTIVGIIQFYLRTIYILCKQRKKMQTLRQQKIHPEVNEKPDEIPTKSTKKENTVTTNAVMDSAVVDLNHLEKGNNLQNERQTKIKPDPELSTGLSNSANILPTSLVLKPSNLSIDVNESATNCKLQKEKLETSVIDLKCTEKEDPQTDTAADSTKVRENSQGTGGTQRLDIVINCTLDGITTKTEIVDSQNSSGVDPDKRHPSFHQASKTGEMKVKTAGNLEASVVDETAKTETICKNSQFSSVNSCDSTEGTGENEKLFVISQVELTVKSVSTLSVDLNEDINKLSSCSYFKDKTESSLQVEKDCVIQRDDNKEAIKSENQPILGTEAKTHQQNENKNFPSVENDRIDKNADVKISANGLSLTTNTTTSLKSEIKESLQMTTEEGTVINVVGPFCPMPKKSKLKQRYRKEAQVTRNIAIFILILIFCWMPLYAIRFLQISVWRSNHCCFSKQYNILWWESLAASTSAFNPCLYGVLNIQLRNEFCRLMKRFRKSLMDARCCR